MDPSMTWIHWWSGSLKVDDTANKRNILHFSLPQCRASRKLSFDILTAIRELLTLIFYSWKLRVNNLLKNNKCGKINFFVFSYFYVALVVTNRKDFSCCKRFNAGSCSSHISYNIPLLINVTKTQLSRGWSKNVLTLISQSRVNRQLSHGWSY